MQTAIYCLIAVIVAGMAGYYRGIWVASCEYAPILHKLYLFETIFFRSDMKKLLSGQKPQVGSVFRFSVDSGITRYEAEVGPKNTMIYRGEVPSQHNLGSKSDSWDVA